MSSACASLAVWFCSCSQYLPFSLLVKTFYFIVFFCPSDPIICIQYLSVISITTIGGQACAGILQTTEHGNSFQIPLKFLWFPSDDCSTFHFENAIFHIHNMFTLIIQKMKYMDASTSDRFLPNSIDNT